MPDARLLTERGRGFPLKRRFVAALAVFALFSLQAAEIAVVAPGSGFGQNLGKHMVRWLGQNNVAADLVDEKNVSTSLKGKRLALLVMPKDAQLAALSAFASRGQRAGVALLRHPTVRLV